MTNDRLYFWPKDWSKLRDDFQRVFRMSMVDLYDPLLSWIAGRFVIKIEVFDERLHERFGEYEETGLSMEDIIREQYGLEGLKIINALI